MGSPAFPSLRDLIGRAEQVVQKTSQVLGKATEIAAVAGRALIGIPLPANIYPIVVPLGGADDPWAASTINQFEPMTFFLNISRNQNIITRGVSAISGVISAFGGPDLGAGLTSVRGPVDLQAGNGRKVNSLRDFNTLARTSYIPSSPDALKASALRQLFVPPLTLLINPKDISIAYTKDIDDRSWTQDGPIVEYKGNNPLRLQANGVMAGMYTGKYGITRRLKTASLSFQQLMSLYLMYRNNGNDFSPTSPGQISIVGAVTIFYDGVFYIGSFDNFNIQEDANSPFRLAYNFNFTARRTIRNLGADIFGNTQITAPFLPV